MTTNTLFNAMDKKIYCKDVTIFISGDKYGLMNDVEEVILPPTYDNIFIETYSSNNMCEPIIKNDFSKGIAKVKKGDFYGFIDKYGKEILECKYNEAYMVSQSLFCVKLGSFWTVVNGANELKLPLLDEIYHRWYDGNHSVRKSYDIYSLAIYKKNNKLGLLNVNEGKGIVVLTPPIYDEINMEELDAINLYIPVRQYNKRGLINKFGDTILKCEYDQLHSWQATNFSEEWNNAYHKLKTNQLTPTDELSYNILESNDIEATVMIDGKYGIVSTMGAVIVPIIYNSAQEAEDKYIENEVYPYC